MAGHTYKQLFAIGITVTLLAVTSWGEKAPGPTLPAENGKPLPSQGMRHPATRSKTNQ